LGCCCAVLLTVIQSYSGTVMTITITIIDGSMINVDSDGRLKGISKTKAQRGVKFRTSP